MVVLVAATVAAAAGNLLLARILQIVVLMPQQYRANPTYWQLSAITPALALIRLHIRAGAQSELFLRQRLICTAVAAVYIQAVLKLARPLFGAAAAVVAQTAAALAACLPLGALEAQGGPPEQTGLSPLAAVAVPQQGLPARAAQARFM
jgi:hypothetical protein